MGQYKVPGKKTVNENLYKPAEKDVDVELKHLRNFPPYSYMN